MRFNSLATKKKQKKHSHLYEMSIVLYIYLCDLKVELFSSNCDLIFFFVRLLFCFFLKCIWVWIFISGCETTKRQKKTFEPVSFVCFMQTCPGEILSASYISLMRDLCLFGNSAFSVLHQRNEKTSGSSPLRCQ